MDGERMKNRRIKRKVLTGLFFLLVIGLLIQVVWSSGTGITSPCQDCHDMKPQTMTWDESLHRNIPCATCHSNPSLFTRLQFSTGIFVKTYQNGTQNDVHPIPIEKSVSNETCLQCHSPNRNVTPRNDLIVPHEKHYLNGVLCMDCHREVAHGNSRIGMKECMECHKNQRIGPLQCTGCHEKMITPDSHKNKTWEREHGSVARLDVEVCEKCHNYINIDGKPLADEEKDVTKYAKKNSFCADCHTNMPSPHENGWAVWHSQSISRESAGQCLVCHELNPPSTNTKSTKTYCSMCHEENLGPAFHAFH